MLADCSLSATEIRFQKCFLLLKHYTEDEISEGRSSNARSLLLKHNTRDEIRKLDHQMRVDCSPSTVADVIPVLYPQSFIQQRIFGRRLTLLIFIGIL